jgi:O-antigen ligase
MVYFLALICLALGGVVLLPNWLLIVWGILIGRLYHNPFMSLGEVDIRIYDVLIFIIMLKVVCFVTLSRRLVFTTLYGPIGGFLLIMFASIMVSYYRFGIDIFTSEIVSFSRFLLLFVIFPLTIHSIYNFRQLLMAEKCLSLFIYAATASIYLGLIFQPFGIEFGEVGTDEQSVRVFGLLGDQVGFILPFFLYRSLIRRKIIIGAFFGLAILLTGTRGTLATVFVGLLIMFFVSAQTNYFWIRRYRSVLLISLAIIAVTISFDPGGMWTRLKDPERLQQGLSARGTTTTVAAEVFRDNILTGVGFSGFRFAALDYQAPSLFAQWQNSSSPLIATAANQYLQVATDAGILGLVMFVWMMARCLQILKVAQTLAPDGVRELFEAGYIWVWSLLVGAQSVAWLLPDMTLSYILWIVMGMAVATVTVKREDGHRAMALHNGVKPEAA